MISDQSVVFQTACAPGEQSSSLPVFSASSGPVCLSCRLAVAQSALAPGQQTSSLPALSASSLQVSSAISASSRLPTLPDSNGPVCLRTPPAVVQSACALLPTSSGPVWLRAQPEIGSIGRIFRSDLVFYSAKRSQSACAPSFSIL